LLSEAQFATLAKSVLRIDILAPAERLSKGAAVLAHKRQSLFLVAGPGTGKTTALALRVLKLLYVDSAKPEAIVATTFTRKAAAELSSRILGWGDRLRRGILLGGGNHGKFEHLDLAKVRIGTLDSLAEDILADFRPASTSRPTVIEDFAKRALMLRSGLFQDGRLRSASLESLIRTVKGNRLNVGTKLDFLSTFRDRLTQDLIKEKSLSRIAERRKRQEFYRGLLRALRAVQSYSAELHKREVIDFAGLETTFLERIQTGGLSEFTDSLQFIFIDEYQDTNPLQESIYLTLAKSALHNRGSIFVVGDDDQALYRFRGATVELFSRFESRSAEVFRGNRKLKKIFLNHNYRSTVPIVQFVNGFVTLDAAYKSVRVSGKPKLVTARQGVLPNVPVIGIFREDAEQLASAIASFIDDLVNRGGIEVRHRNRKIQLDAAGTANDIAFLASSIREERNDGEPRLPVLLRRKLAALRKPIQVFNPRGQALIAVDDIQRLMGLMLECIDPHAKVERSIGWLQGLRPVFDSWRTAAQQVAKNHRDPELRRFVRHWAMRRTHGRTVNRIERVPLNDLLYKLISWIPRFVDDIERVVQFEAISRTIADSALFSSFGAEVLFAPNRPGDSLGRASVRAALQDIFAPLASGAIDLNEDLFETLPRDRLSFMTVHQAKGLEFPVVIVDVGSDFTQRHSSQAFRRFPEKPGESQAFEDLLSPFMSESPFKRTGRDRAFDDLIRQYFVAFSRAQDVLVLTGLDSVKTGYQVKSGERMIENIATGWSRDGRWHWRTGLSNLRHF